MPELEKFTLDAADVEVAADVVAFLSEDGLSPRRERAAFVARLRDKHKLKYREIGKQLNVSLQRAHQLYALNGLFSK